MDKQICCAAIIAVLLSGATGCGKKDKIHVLTDEEAPKMATMLAMSDPRAPTQLLLGFYALESGGWRWTAGHFSVALRPPRDAAQAGAVLKFKFSVPQAVLDKVKSTTLSASVGGTALPPQTYTKAGDYEYVRDVVNTALPSESVKVDFALSKFLAAGVVEGRELGVISTSVGFEHK